MGLHKALKEVKQMDKKLMFRDTLEDNLDSVKEMTQFI